MPSDATRPYLNSSRGLPSFYQNNTEAPARASSYGELYVQPVDGKALALEGSYYVARNPTPGTGVAHTADPTAIGATDAVFYALKNTSAEKHVILDYLRLRCTAAGTAGTVQEVAVTVDDGTVNRYTSGGAANTPIVCGPTGTAAAQVSSYLGALVTVANAAEKVVAHQIMRMVIPVAGDIYSMSFRGGGASGPQSATVTDSTAILLRHVDCAPVIVSPGCWLTVQLVRASQSAAASWEFEAGLIVR
jgi:hypothetical protein